MIIFLDLDGVLRRNFSPPSFLEECCLEPFCEAMRALAAARIVISSGWRIGSSLEDIRRHFPTDVARRIVDMTPVLETTEPHARYKEVQQYLQEHGAAGETWVALEDDPNHFPAGCANVVLLDPAKGFDAEAKETLLRRAG
jgi:hypothetical protein